MSIEFAPRPIELVLAVYEIGKHVKLVWHPKVASVLEGSSSCPGPEEVPYNTVPVDTSPPIYASGSSAPLSTESVPKVVVADEADDRSCVNTSESPFPVSVSTSFFFLEPFCAFRSSFSFFAGGASTASSPLFFCGVRCFHF